MPALHFANEPPSYAGFPPPLLAHPLHHLPAPRLPLHLPCCSYLAPIVHDLAAQQPAITRAQGTFAIVICPTRELCLQVADVLTMLARRFVWLVGGAVHGGEHRGKEKARLRKGVTVVVATPGRLLDHLQNTQAFRTGGCAGGLLGGWGGLYAGHGWLVLGGCLLLPV